MRSRRSFVGLLIRVERDRESLRKTPWSCQTKTLKGKFAVGVGEDSEGEHEKDKAQNICLLLTCYVVNPGWVEMAEQQQQEEELEQQALSVLETPVSGPSRTGRAVNLARLLHHECTELLRLYVSHEVGVFFSPDTVTPLLLPVTSWCGTFLCWHS